MRGDVWKSVRDTLESVGIPLTAACSSVSVHKAVSILLQSEHTFYNMYSKLKYYNFLFENRDVSPFEQCSVAVIFLTIPAMFDDLWMVLMSIYSGPCLWWTSSYHVAQPRSQHEENWANRGNLPAARLWSLAWQITLMVMCLSIRIGFCSLECAAVTVLARVHVVS